MKQILDIIKRNAKSYLLAVWALVIWGAKGAVRGAAYLFAAFPMPWGLALIAWALVMVVWWFWPSGESENRPRADKAAEEGVSITAEVEQGKTGIVQAETNVNAQVPAVERASEEVAAKGVSVKKARERVAETKKIAQRALEERARQRATEQAKLDEVIANCEKVYESCR